LFEDYLLGSTSLQWVARLAIGLGVLALFLGVRRRLQAVAQAFIVPAIDRQLSSLVATDTEEREAARLQILAKTSDSLVNVAYLVAGYFTVVLPVTAAVTGYSNLNWVSPVTYAVFLLAVAATVISSIRRIVPALHPSMATG
jgi:hypothetical protein